MINRDNWIITEKWLDHMRNVRQAEEATIVRCRIYTRHILEWLDETRLIDAPQMRPTFPQYIVTAKMRGDGRMSIDTIKRTMVGVKLFFKWLRNQDRRYFNALDHDWLESLRPPKLGEQIRERKLYTLENVRKLVAVPAYSLREKRDRAAVAFMFLSGMRIGAFVTLPIQAVDMENGAIKQLPQLGVRTKFKKAAITYLLPIPDLLEVVREWDDLIRPSLPLDALWYTHISTTQEQLLPTPSTGDKRRYRFDAALRELCKQAGIPYLSSHKFRHGHTVYALSKAKTPADVKAVSQNLMHSSITITDGVYGRLTSNDVQQRIFDLQQEITNGEPSDVTIDEVMQMLQQMKKNQQEKAAVSKTLRERWLYPYVAGKGENCVVGMPAT